MLPHWVLNLGPLTYKSGALPIALRGPADTWIQLQIFPPYLQRVLNCLAALQAFEGNGSTLKEKKLLIEEQILSLKNYHLRRRDAK